METEADGKMHINIFPIAQRQLMQIFWYTFLQIFTYAILEGTWEKIFISLNPLSLLSYVSSSHSVRLSLMCSFTCLGYSSQLFQH